ncbi:sugar ABC transporter substrate-binding protein [Sellimonas intestinalis]|uniref:ABC transporter substrate-binding protein n=2 Tax=Sellimonas intestinalis TaxID=1653434 RepID=UPI000E3FE2E5|nr:sugar ABC transporter substrate-binding protein [Sellimonas intestinalis]RGD36130.1 sugar ABC transporter substrate-binding protein [Sellimonas intestinalis]
MRKNIKKLAAVGLTAVLGAGLLAGCGGDGKSSGGSKDGKVELVMSVWDSDQQPVMEKMAEAYNKEHPNVHVTTQLTTWSEYWTKLEASATGGSAPDIITMNVLHVEEYADAGILLDLTDAEKESDLKVNENFPAPLVDGYTVDGKLYGIPKDFDTNAVFYNKEIFDKAGVEYPSDNMTFEDFKAKCEELKNAGLPEGTYPTAVNRNSGQTTYDASVFANGGYFLSEGNEKSGWDDPKTIEAVQSWLDLVSEGLSPTLDQMADTDPDAMFQGGQLAMYLSGNYMIASYDKTLEGKYGIAKRPTYNGKDTDIINGLAFSVSANTKHPEEATDFALWLGSEEAQKINGEAGVCISARNDCQQYFVDAHEGLNCQIFLDNVVNAELLPHCKITSQLGQVEKKYLEPAWKGEVKLEDACKSVAEEQNKLLEEMNAK